MTITVIIRAETMLEHIWPPHIITSRKITIHPGPELAVEGTLAEGRVCTARGVAWEDLPPGGKLMYAGTSHAGLPGVREILQHTCLSSSAAKCLTKKKGLDGTEIQIGQNKKPPFFNFSRCLPLSTLFSLTMNITYNLQTLNNVREAHKGHEQQE